MTFENIIWLWLSPVLGLITLAILALGWRKRRKLLESFASPRLLDQLTERASTPRVALKSVLIIAAVCALGAALARPQFGVEWSERKARGLDIIFVIDSSKSMLATDIRPTRLDRAKLAVLDLVDRLESDRIGLVAFSGQAFLQTPPTLDYAAFRESLDATDTSILSGGGSDIGQAIEEAAKAFPRDNNVKVVILLTDGEDLGGQAIEAALKNAKDGIRFYTIGIGTPEGEYLRVRNDEGIEKFLRDADGQPVRSQLDEPTLQQIAQLSGGSYTRLGSGSLETFYNTVLANLPREERSSELKEVKIERFQWLLAAVISFLMLEILIRSRRHRSIQVALILTTFALFIPKNSEASDDALQTYNKAHIAMSAGDYDQANELYTSAMKLSNERNLQRDALNNMGHATFQQGLESYNSGNVQAALETISKAEELFNSALELDSTDKTIADDAARTKAVRKAIEQFLKQQEKEQQSENQEQNNEQQSEDSDSEEQQDQGSTSSQTQDRQNEPDEPNQEQQQDNGSKSQEQSGGETEQTEDHPPSEAQDNSSSSETKQNEETPEQNNSQEGNNNDDVEQEEQATSQSEENAEENEQKNSAQQSQESSEAQDDDKTDNTSTSSVSVPVEGMTVEQAKVLLDSLQRNEEILPFTQPVPGKDRPIQDW